MRGHQRQINGSITSLLQTKVSLLIYLKLIMNLLKMTTLAKSLLEAMVYKNYIISPADLHISGSFKMGGIGYNCFHR